MLFPSDSFLLTQAYYYLMERNTKIWTSYLLTLIQLFRVFDNFRLSKHNNYLFDHFRLQHGGELGCEQSLGHRRDTCSSQDPDPNI